LKVNGRKNPQSSKNRELTTRALENPAKDVLIRGNGELVKRGRGASGIYPKKRQGKGGKRSAPPGGTDKGSQKPARSEQKVSEYGKPRRREGGHVLARRGIRSYQEHGRKGLGSAKVCCLREGEKISLPFIRGQRNREGPRIKRGKWTLSWS